MSGEGGPISNTGGGAARTLPPMAEADAIPRVRLGDLTLGQLYDIIDARITLNTRRHMHRPRF